MKQLFLFFVIVFSFTQGYSQFKFNEAVNCFTNVCYSEPSDFPSQDLKEQLNQTTGVPCDPNSFWAINFDNQVEKFQIVGGTIVSNGIITSPSPEPGLAYCNNLNGGSFSPTFYCSGYNGDTAYYYDGTNWISTANAPAPFYVGNLGGNGNYLYFQDNSYNTPVHLLSYDGFGFNTIFSDSVLKFTSADIAVDDSGNIWCFRGPAIYNSQYISVFSPSGQLIKQYNFIMDPYLSYGCLLLNSILYVGFGPGNSMYPDKLVPISLANDTAIAGIPLTMPSNFYVDLASCNAGAPLTVLESRSSHINCKIYPNPSEYNIQVECDYQDGFFEITDLGGKLLTKGSFNSSVFQIDISYLSYGIYFLSLFNKEKQAHLKFVKE